MLMSSIMSDMLNNHIVNATYSVKESQCEFGPFHVLFALYKLSVFTFYLMHFDSFAIIFWLYSTFKPRVKVNSQSYRS